MHLGVISAQGATLREWAQQWARLEIPGAIDMHRRLSEAAEVAEAIAAGLPIPAALAELPAMARTEAPRDDEAMREG